MVHNEPNQSIQHTAPTNPYSDDDQLMLSEHDFDNVVLYVDSSTKRRSMMTEALEAAGIRCIGVDAWPEAIRMYNTLNLQGLLCNASRLQPTELRFWCSHLKGRPNSVHIALIQDIQLPAMKKHDLGGIILQIIPANIEAICQMLDLNNSGVAPVQVLSPQSDATSPPQTLDSEPHASNSAHIVKYPSAAH